MSKSVEVRRTINAQPSRIWAILTDAAKLQSSGCGSTKIEGSIVAGARFKLFPKSVRSARST